MTTAFNTEQPLDRLTELESKIAFQDITIADLNQELAIHQERLERIQQQLKLMFSQMNDIKGSHMASEAHETPPPHY